MKKLLISAAVVGLMSSAAAPALAQSAAPAPTAHGANASRYHVAVVDISFIFKNYPGFTGQIEKLKGEMEAADGALRTERDRLVQMEEERNTKKPGSPEFKQLDENLARLKAEFTIKQGTVRRDFLEKEATVYFTCYNQVAAAVKAFADKNDIGMVLRFTGDDVADKSAAPDREAVMRMIMQPIIHQNKIDITPDVLMMLGVDVRNLPAQPNGVPATATRPTAPAQGGFQGQR
ncbi:OmpH family outer membrane protein [Lacipirellula limnantheis]|uniref:Outer membrane protein (OmpH-like) n=1 Tax=Lacipirellula limnantheis TaxID=2528024 RepID=A0A517TWB6_9BACT|nr:OmpH family outer membrane protein [Lacipirellula limnantheis]QDT72669.1 Outer membrane protein (OmpH-like) [Lacipirellula limnantheis]